MREILAVWWPAVAGGVVIVVLVAVLLWRGREDRDEES